MKSQLFRRNPDRYIINDLMVIFNIKYLDDEDFYFTKQDLTNLNIIDKMSKNFWAPYLKGRGTFKSGRNLG